MIYLELLKTIESYLPGFDQITPERKVLLAKLSDFVQARAGRKAELIFICTHNSRRSHISQIWAQAAAAYYEVGKVFTYSGGTEATAFNDRAVRAMQSVGFKIVKRTEGLNPVYDVSYANGVEPLKVWSKAYDDSRNPGNGFCAVMTCDRADQNCPVVTGAETRIALPYDDPGDSDNTPLEAATYAERVKQIGQEMLYVFSLIK